MGVAEYHSVILCRQLQNTGQKESCYSVLAIITLARDSDPCKTWSATKLKLWSRALFVGERIRSVHGTCTCCRTWYSMYLATFNINNLTLCDVMSFLGWIVIYGANFQPVGMEWQQVANNDIANTTAWSVQWITWKERHLPKINSEAFNNYFYTFLLYSDH